MRHWLCTAALAALAATPAMAQDNGLGGFSSMDIMQMATMDGTTAVMTDAIKKQPKGAATPQSGASGFAGGNGAGGLTFDFSGDPGAGATAPTSAAYRFDPAVRTKLAETMAKAARPESAAEMRRVVASGEAVRVYEQVGPAMGLRRDDAIDGLVFYMLAQWGVANDYREMFTRAQVDGVRRQAAASYAGVAGKLNSDALRQEFGEMLMVQGAIMAGVHENAVKAGNEEAAARYAAIAREGGTKVFSVDPTTIALTSEGFRKK